MKIAIISDIHSNLEAFEAVLKDIDSQQVEKIYCLGDLVGYGPNPVECIDRMMELQRKGLVQVCLQGNHDQAALFDPDGFNSIAESAIYWTRDQLERQTNLAAQRRWEFLGEIPRYYKNDRFMFVHGSPRNPLNEYVFSDDILEESKMEKLFAIIPKYCFQGHTHVPGIFTESLKYFRSSELPDGRYDLKDEKLMINVGSVGQPRDRDPRACYVTVDLDENYVQYHRVDYNIEVTCQKIFDIPELDNFLGERIKQGK